MLTLIRTPSYFGDDLAHGQTHVQYQRRLPIRGSLQMQHTLVYNVSHCLVQCITIVLVVNYGANNAIGYQHRMRRIHFHPQRAGDVPLPRNWGNLDQFVDLPSRPPAFNMCRGKRKLGAEIVKLLSINFPLDMAEVS